MSHFPERGSRSNHSDGFRRGQKREGGYGQRRELRSPSTESLLERARVALGYSQKAEFNLDPSMVVSIREYVRARWRALEAANVPSINRGELINFFQDGRGPVFMLSGSELEHFQQLIETRKAALFAQFQEKQNFLFDSKETARDLVDGGIGRITLALEDSLDVFAALKLEEELVTEENHWRFKVELKPGQKPELMIFVRFKRLEAKQIIAERAAAVIEQNWSRENFTEDKIIGYLFTRFKSAQEEFDYYSVVLSLDSPVAQLLLHSCNGHRDTTSYREWQLEPKPSQSNATKIKITCLSEKGNPDQETVRQLIWWVFGNVTEEFINSLF